LDVVGLEQTRAQKWDVEDEFVVVCVAEPKLPQNVGSLEKNSHALRVKSVLVFFDC